MESFIIITTLMIKCRASSYETTVKGMSFLMKHNPFVSYRKGKVFKSGCHQLITTFGTHKVLTIAMMLAVVIAFGSYKVHIREEVEIYAPVLSVSLLSFVTIFVMSMIFFILIQSKSI